MYRILMAVHYEASTSVDYVFANSRFKSRNNIHGLFRRFLYCGGRSFLPKLAATICLETRSTLCRVCVLFAMRQTCCLFDASHQQLVISPAKTTSADCNVVE